MVGGNKIVITNESYDNKEPPKLSLIRYILVSASHYKNIIRLIIKENNQSELIKHNFYAPIYIMSCIKSNNCADIFNVYRKNKVLDFINENSLLFNLTIKESHYINNDDYFSEWNDYD